MPKRNCPFDDNLTPQLKVHVGARQINTGVAKDELMKNVYDKTLNLLRQGVKVLSQNLNTLDESKSINIPLLKVPTVVKIKPERNMKQMVLNSKLQLEETNKIVNDNQIELCGCCCIINNVSSKCFYCDQVLCSSCLTQCINCFESFCQNCCLPAYDVTESSVCLNCYR